LPIPEGWEGSLKDANGLLSEGPQRGHLAALLFFRRVSKFYLRSA
jgi:hypothetical protein